MSNSTGKHHTVVCFGDSNTHGTVPLNNLGDVNRYRSADRWTGILAKSLGPSWHLVEEGHPGRTTVHDDPIEGANKNGKNALPIILETHAPIDLVILMLGTNDLKVRFSVTAQDIGNSIGKLIDVIASSGAGPNNTPPAVLVVSPVPISETGIFVEMFNGGAAKSKRLAPIYERIAERFEVAFFDAGAHARTSPVDGIHLSRDAHQSLGEALSGFLLPILRAIERQPLHDRN